MNPLSSLAIDTTEPGKIRVRPAQTTAETVLGIAQKYLSELQENMFGGEQFDLSILNSKSADIRRFYAVRARSNQADIVLKINLFDKQRDRFQREAMTQQRMYDQYLDVAGLHVPKVLYISENQPFFVMEYARGSTIYGALRNHILVEDEDAVFHQAGQWLAKIHQLRATENVSFAPNEATRNLTVRLNGAEKAVSGTYMADEFDRYYQKLMASQAEFDGRDNPVVLGHGDFHGDNLVFSNSGCTGLDFYNVRRLSAGLDIARFLVHADLSQFEDPAKIGALGLVQSHQDAFFDGYGLKLSPDHVFNYFIRLRLLETWSKFPAETHATHVAQSSLDLMVQRVELAFRG